MVVQEAAVNPAASDGNRENTFCRRRTRVGRTSAVRCSATWATQVETRTSPIEALEAFRANPQKFDLVITDMTMPNMTGLRLAKKVNAISPGIPVMLCTGFSDQANEHRAHGPGDSGFSAEAPVMRDLAEAVRKALDGPR